MSRPRALVAGGSGGIVRAFGRRLAATAGPLIPTRFPTSLNTD
ncbi:hypothetical protein PHK61_08135 [Actinomycetospora lutea]|nr:hypothetical protein [Actinomycetospora lutea]MDD7938386.1 hypothetical protein [Actinomycetospora lutea]